MARNDIFVSADRERVFDVLADPRSFAHWVVGSRTIRSADDRWPEVGTAFDHSIGVWPFVIRDHSEVEAVRRPELLRLRVKGRPLGVAYVTLELRPEAGGTHVTMTETAADRRTAALVHNGLGERLLRARNAASLRRLKALAEGTETMPTGDLPARESAAEASIRSASRTRRERGHGT